MYNLSPMQSRMARAALRWDLRDAADAAGIGVNTVLRFEQGRSEPHKSTVTMLSTAYESEGIVFVEGGVLTELPSEDDATDGLVMATGNEVWSPSDIATATGNEVWTPDDIVSHGLALVGT